MLTAQETFSSLSYLECSRCGSKYATENINTYASCELGQCQNPLLARYDNPVDYPKDILRGRVHSMWRYHEMLPVLDFKNIVSLGEGMTPILRLENLSRQRNIDEVWLKDEALNPTGSFKARGLSAAISKAKELGISKCIIPTAGNAGGAMSAYCAKAGMEAIVVMPRHTPAVFKQECNFYGAEVILVDGLISDCGKKAAEIMETEDCFNLSTLKEPYRLEGKKTMGYEIAEQFSWELPDVILYPTGGGTGLIGIWKAFSEMQQLGWTGSKLPKMIAVQAENCDPIVRAFNGNANGYTGKPSLANGLVVPCPFGKQLILEVLKESGGMAISISDHEMIQGVKTLAQHEGLFVAPEGGALWAALKKLIHNGFLTGDEKILLLNTGSGYKYLENMTD